MIKNQDYITYLTALLSSSCCIIQLILNSFSISCAGFAVLTPYRSLFTSITILLLSYHLYHKGVNNSKLCMIISVIFMLSPEIIQYINQQTAVGTAATTHHHQHHYYYRIHLDGLGCEACANRVKNTLNSIEWIINTRVYFNNQTAIVKSSKKLKDFIILEDLIKSIDNKKYDAQVLDSWVATQKNN